MNETLTAVFLAPLIIGLVGYVLLAARMLYRAVTTHSEEVEDELSDLV